MYRFRRASVAAAILLATGVGLPIAAGADPSEPTPTGPTTPTTPTGIEVSADGAALEVGDAGSLATLAAITPEAGEGTWTPTSDTTDELDSAIDGLTYRAEAEAASVSVIAVIDEGVDQDEFRFQVDLPEGSTLIAEDDGSVAIVGPDGTSTSGFEPPWAVDAGGAHLATSYRVDGDTIVQAIDLDAAESFPVTADPKFTKGWVTGTVYFDVRETIDIGDSSGYSAVCAGFIVAGPAAVAGCGLQINTITATARKARRADKCLKVKFPLTMLVTGVGGFFPGTYSGGYCTK